MAPTRHLGVTSQVSSAEVAFGYESRAQVAFCRLRAKAASAASAKADKLFRVRYQKSAGREKGEMFTGGRQLFGKRANRSLCG